MLILVSLLDGVGQWSCAFAMGSGHSSGFGFPGQKPVGDASARWAAIKNVLSQPCWQRSGNSPIVHLSLLVHLAKRKLVWGFARSLQHSEGHLCSFVLMIQAGRGARLPAFCTWGPGLLDQVFLRSIGMGPSPSV